MQNYVFYDFETTGISPAFDQPLQFAAIITDDALNELDRIDISATSSTHFTFPSRYESNRCDARTIIRHKLPRLF